MVPGVARILACLILFALGSHAEELKVATLHPLLADLARQVGGERVEVVELVTRHDDPHHFEPTPATLRKATGMELCLASGMGLESYLPSLKSILPEGARLVEIGSGLPTLAGSCDHPDHHHDEGDTDPHWWHSVDAFRRAATATATTFAEADPDGADYYRSRSMVYRRKLDQLERWTRRELARVPAEKRTLATAHAAFGYFCHEYGYTALPVQGLNREQMPDAASLAALIGKLRKSGVTAIFPETSSNPKILEALTADTGIRIADPLISDGTTTDSYEAMVRHNVETIVRSLGTN